jgi:hypothetical protein
MPDYPDIFPDSPDFPEYPEKYPESPDLHLTAAKKFVIFRFDYSPPPPLVDILILSAAYLEQDLSSKRGSGGSALAGTVRAVQAMETQKKAANRGRRERSPKQEYL